MKDVKVGDIKQFSYKHCTMGKCYENVVTGYVTEVTEDVVKFLSTAGNLRFALKQNIVDIRDVKLSDAKRKILADMVKTANRIEKAGSELEECRVVMGKANREYEEACREMLVQSMFLNTPEKGV